MCFVVNPILIPPCIRERLRYLSILICHWKAGVVSQANELEDRLIDLMKTQLVEELIDESQQLFRILNSSAKTAKERLKRGK